MLIRAFLYRHLPESGKVFTRLGPQSKIASTYCLWRAALRERLATWHRAELRSLDPAFDFDERMKALVNAREAAREQGIGPADLRYPELSDFFSEPNIGGPSKDQELKNSANLSR